MKVTPYHWAPTMYSMIDRVRTGSYPRITGSSLCLRKIHPRAATPSRQLPKKNPQARARSRRPKVSPNGRIEAADWQGGGLAPYWLAQRVPIERIVPVSGVLKVCSKGRRREVAFALFAGSR